MSLEKQFIEDFKGADATFQSDRERQASVNKITKISSVMMVLVSGLALFSDGKPENRHEDP
jgi:hypothetical protein